MVMGTAQFWAASTFAHTLEQHVQDQRLPWFVASMLPIQFTVAALPERHQLAPDCFVAFVPSRERSSYNLAEEGVFPPFVLEVASPSSLQRDTKEKVRAYGLLGALEYVLFTPASKTEANLKGYRWDARGRRQPWPTDADGGLWSEVLRLRLGLRGGILRAWTAQGDLLRTLAEESRARAEAEHARADEVLARQVEARAREAAEAEADRLRRELEQLRRAQS